MSESYKELLVKRDKSILGTIGKYILGVLTILMLFVSFITAGIVFLIITIALAALTYIVAINADVEFEYLYVDRELSIDKILAKSKRRKAGNFTVERMEILAPYKSHRVDSYRDNKNYKEVNFTSKKKDNEKAVYMMVYEGNKKILLEPDYELVKAIYNNAPRKVFTD